MVIHGMPPLTMKEQYLWYANHKINPWDRINLNVDFLKYERIRIENLKKWWWKFRAQAYDSYIEEISYYTIPVELDNSWKSTIAEYGDYNYFGLSGLHNSPQMDIIGLFLPDAKYPAQRELIRITKAKKTILFNKILGTTYYGIIIEDWERLKSDSIFLDASYEKNIAQKILQETLSLEAKSSSSIQSTILSAPYVQGSVGGISLASFANHTTFAQEFAKTMQLMVPPQYRSVSPPQKALIGLKFSPHKGMDFLFAEIHPPSSDYFSSFYDPSYLGVTEELTERKAFKGEYSIFSTIGAPEGSNAEKTKELLANFARTEITFPESIDELRKYNDLTILKRSINEDIWAQVVHAHHIAPSFDSSQDSEFTKKGSYLEKDFEVLLSDAIPTQIDRELTARKLASSTLPNLRRLAESFARADASLKLEVKHLNQAHNLIKDNFTGFVNNPQFSSMKSAIVTSLEKEKDQFIQTQLLLSKEGMSLREIYDELPKQYILFKDIHELQNKIQHMHEQGFVMLNIQKKYSWVGKPFY